jgi:DeoR/GlpR family transcriptional regulator of sugar metabolism
VSPRDAVFLDSSSTSYYVASRLLELGVELTVITNSLPVMRLVATQAPAGVELVAIGGILRKLTQSFVGPHAIRTIHGHFTDRAFLSVTGVTDHGVLADVDPLEADVKRNMVAHAHEAILLIDRSKLTATGRNAIGPISDISLALAHGVQSAEVHTLERLGVPVRTAGNP